MKTDIWVKYSANITKKKGVSKSQNISIFFEFQMLGTLWRGLASKHTDIRQKL